MFNVFEALVKTIRDRKSSSEQESYTKKLLVDNNLCREKVMEEINELVDALSKKKKEEHEAADVIDHLLDLLEANDIKIEDVLGELKKRQGISGLVEKANRE